MFLSWPIGVVFGLSTISLNHGGDLDAMMLLTPAITRSAAYWRVQSGDRQFKWRITSLKWQSPVQSSDRQFKVANREFKVTIASFRWRSPVQSGESPVQSGDRQFKVAIASSKWRSPVQSGESPVQSGDRQFKVAIASSKWQIASWKIYHYTMALNGQRTLSWLCIYKNQTPVIVKFNTIIVPNGAG